MSRPNPEADILIAAAEPKLKSCTVACTCLSNCDMSSDIIESIAFVAELCSQPTLTIVTNQQLHEVCSLVQLPHGFS